VVTLEYLVHRADLRLDAIDCTGPIGRHADERGDVAAELARVEQRRVAEHDAGLFELVDALDDGWGRKPHLLSDRRERLLTVLL
jgi:hypothetical protein